MQRSYTELQAMTHDELVDRVLEMQDMLREGLAVRDSLHRILNELLKAKAEEVESYAELPVDQLAPEEVPLKEAWAKARHAVANPAGAMWAMRQHP